MLTLSCLRVNARVNLRRNNFDPLLIFFPMVTTYRVLSSVGSATQRINIDPPTLQQVVSTWTCCGGRLAPRRANEGYTAEPSALARLVCQAYHRCPGRTLYRPPCLNSLTQEAHRAGPPRP